MGGFSAHPLRGEATASRSYELAPGISWHPLDPIAASFLPQTASNSLVIHDAAKARDVYLGSEDAAYRAFLARGAESGTAIQGFEATPVQKAGMPDQPMEWGLGLILGIAFLRRKRPSSKPWSPGDSAFNEWATGEARGLFQRLKKELDRKDLYRVATGTAVGALAFGVTFIIQASLALSFVVGALSLSLFIPRIFSRRLRWDRLLGRDLPHAEPHLRSVPSGVPGEASSFTSRPNVIREIRFELFDPYLSPEKRMAQLNKLGAFLVKVKTTHVEFGLVMLALRDVFSKRVKFSNTSMDILQQNQFEMEFRVRAFEHALIAINGLPQGPEKNRWLGFWQKECEQVFLAQPDIVRSRMLPKVKELLRSFGLPEREWVRFAHLH